MGVSSGYGGGSIMHVEMATLRATLRRGQLSCAANQANYICGEPAKYVFSRGLFEFDKWTGSASCGNPEHTRVTMNSEFDS
jgi:hypothetical protein